MAEVEYNLKTKLDSDHAIKMAEKEREKKFVENKLREGEIARQALADEKAEIKLESKRLLEKKEEEERKLRDAQA